MWLHLDIASLEICLTAVGIEPTACGMQAQCSAGWTMCVFRNWVMFLRCESNLKCNDDSVDICVGVVYSDEYYYFAGIDILYANASNKEIRL